MAQLLEPDRSPGARRSALEVRMDVLRAVAEGVSKQTRIMYRSNTSWVVLQKNLEALQASGFVRQSGGSARPEYTILEGGLAVLRDYDQLVKRARSSPA